MVTYINPNAIEDGTISASKLDETIATKSYVDNQIKVTNDKINDFKNAGYLYAGVAAPPTNPGTPDTKVFYIANGKGEYANFGGLEVTEDDVVILYYDTSWHKVATGIASQEKLTELSAETMYPFLADEETVSSNNIAKYNSDIAKGTQIGLLLQSVSNGYMNAIFVYYTDGSYDRLIQGINQTANYFYKFIAVKDVKAIGFYITENGATIKATIYKSVVTKINELEKYVETKEANISARSIGDAKLVETYLIKEDDKNLFDKDRLIVGKYLNPNGTLYNADSMSSTDYIRVKPSTHYYLSAKGDSSVGTASTVLLFYDETKKIISDTRTNQKSFVTPINAYFVRFTIYNSLSIETQFEEGQSRTSYEPYKLLPNYLDVKTKKAVNAYNGRGLDCLYTAKDSLNNTSLLLSNYPKNLKRGGVISFGGTIRTFNLIRVGFGGESNDPLGLYIEIDNQKITLVYSYNGSVIKQQEHNLTIGTFIDVSLSVRDFDVLAIVTTLSGSIKIDATLSDNEVQGIPYALVDATTTLNDVKLSCTNKDFQRDIWIFGDSYTTLHNNKSWINALMFGYGIDNFAIFGKAGGRSNELLTDFKRAINCGCPKFALWCMGMNDTETDTNTANANWVACAEEFVQLCEEYAITPIFTTVPSTPTMCNVNKMNWVRNSGYRYIDMSKAVNGDSYTKGVTYWYGGLIEDEAAKAHPNALGAKVLASQALLDFPEFLQY